MEKAVDHKILFLTLRVCSAMGGIEKVCRVMGKALWEIGDKKLGKLAVFSMYDAPGDAANDRYFPSSIFRGFGKSKFRFMLAAIKKGMACDTVILSHLNLLPAGRIIKMLRPKTKLILLAHGIEIWGRLPSSKKKMLQACDQIWAVSNYTRQRIIEEQQVVASKIKVLNNCLDPFLPAPLAEKKSSALLEKYGFAATDVIMLMLSRIAATERHKNYDTVIAAMPAAMKATSKNIRYLIAGKFTADEAAHINAQASKFAVGERVTLAGYISDEALAAHFALADLYVMPSSKEGFGIVFIEAMYYGLPVIAGNSDGSADALLNGALGLMVSPGDVAETSAAIVELIHNNLAYLPEPVVMHQHFGYEDYRFKITQLLNTAAVT